jgi:hypothetical protein
VATFRFRFWLFSDDWFNLILSLFLLFALPPFKSQGVDAFRNEFMKQESIPGIAWHVALKGSYSEFIKKFIIPMEAVKSGKEPPIDSSSCCSCAIL